MKQIIRMLEDYRSDERIMIQSIGPENILEETLNLLKTWFLKTIHRASIYRLKVLISEGFQQCLIRGG